MWLASALAASCYSPHPPAGAACAADGDCPVPLTCDLATNTCGGATDGGTRDAILDSAIDAARDAGSACTCLGANQLSCAGQLTNCDLGCEDGPPARCTSVVPSNGVVVSTAGTSPITVVDSVVVNTDTGSITSARPGGSGNIDGIVYEQTSFEGVPLGVFAVQSLNVTAAGTITFTGSRAVVVVVAGDITIAGLVDASAHCPGNVGVGCGAVGGGNGGTVAVAATGCGPGGAGQLSTGVADGGGGGGGGEAGGFGGGGPVSSGANPGPACIATTLEPLGGGAGGGVGNPDGTDLGNGGGGGGAIQLSSLGGTITISGQILAQGEGGGGGASINAGGGGGGGGGAGGGVLLEAASVHVSGVIAANGGGGGGGGTQTASGTPGENGSDDAQAAQGGRAGSPASGIGGNGGCAASNATNGGGALMIGDAGGGGGGGVGVVFVRARTSMLGGTISPAAGTGALRTQ